MKKIQDMSLLKKYIEKNKIDVSPNNSVVDELKPHQYKYGDINSQSCNVPYPLINRFSSYLLKHAKNKEYVNLNSSIQEIAHFFGTSYRTLNKTLKEMESDSIINCKGKRVYILDIEALRGLSEKSEN